MFKIVYLVDNRVLAAADLFVNMKIVHFYNKFEFQLLLISAASCQ